MDINSIQQKYQVIYADPPWSYNSGKPHARGRGAELHYPTMKPHEIMELDVNCLADTNCILFMWTTAPMMDLAMNVITAWGFTYKTMAFTWIKTCKTKEGFVWGGGQYTRSNPEFCLLATKGKPRRVSASVHSVIPEPRREHSRKPDVARDRIVQLMGDIPRIELFAREQALGWDAWGNDTEKFNTKELSI